MAEKEETRKLKGEVNYLGWSRLIMAELIVKGCLLPLDAPAIDTTKSVIEQAKELELTLKIAAAKSSQIVNGLRLDSDKEMTARYLITKSIAMNVLNNIPIHVESAHDLLIYAKTEFGFVNAYTRKQKQLKS